MELNKHNCNSLLVKSNSSAYIHTAYLIIAFICYQGLVKLGWIFYLDSEHVSTLWLASGLLLWLFFVSEQKLWWLIAVSYYVGDNLITLFSLTAEHYSLQHLIGSFANIGEAMFGAWLLHRSSFLIERFYTVRNIILFILLGVLVSTAVFGIVGALSAYWTHSDTRFVDLFITWMTADALGILLLFPVLVAWLNYPHSLPPSYRDYEAVIFIIFTFIATYFIFTSNGESDVSFFNVPYLILTLIIFSAIRYDEKFSIMLVFILSLVAMYFSNNLIGPFVHAHNTTHEIVIVTQVFIAVLSLVALVLTVSYSELKQKNIMQTLTNQQLATEIEQKSLALKEKDVAEKKLQHAQKVETIGNLSAGIAHDFNNMLTSLLGYTKLAKEHAPEEDNKMLRYLNQIQQGAQRGKEIIDKLMVYSRHEDQAAKLLDINKFIQERVDYYSVSLSDSIQLIVNLDPSSPKILIDPIQLDQIVINLLVNARDAIQGEGYINVSIENMDYISENSNVTHENFTGNYICVTVADNGKGIDPELIEHIFEPFFTTKEMGQGTGLGLSTVYGIVSEVGGKLQVNSSLGKGTEIKIYFPHDIGNKSSE